MPAKDWRASSIKSGWTAKQLTYMKWLCWPDTELDPNFAYKSQIAALLGVETDTLRNWEALPGWDEAVQAMSRRVMMDLQPAFFKNIAENMLARKPSDKIIQTYFRYILPAITAEKPLWENLIQLKSDKSLGEARKQALMAEIMELPDDVRDTIFGYMQRLLAEPEVSGEAEVVEQPTAEFRRQPGDRRVPVTGEGKKEVVKRSAATAIKAAPQTFIPITKPMTKLELLQSPKIDQKDNEKNEKS